MEFVKAKPDPDSMTNACGFVAVKVTDMPATFVKAAAEICTSAASDVEVMESAS